MKVSQFTHISYSKYTVKEGKKKSYVHLPPVFLPLSLKKIVGGHLTSWILVVKLLFLFLFTEIVISEDCKSYKVMFQQDTKLKTILLTAQKNLLFTSLGFRSGLCSKSPALPLTFLCMFLFMLIPTDFSSQQSSLGKMSFHFLQSKDLQEKPALISTRLVPSLVNEE